MFASSFTAFFPEFSGARISVEDFSFFFLEDGFLSFPDCFPSPALFKARLCAFFARAVCDHRALAPRETPQIAKSKRVILISRE
jgi:hypothetical protein